MKGFDYTMEKKCPYCGSPIPAEASFCPHCAKSLNKRAQARPPRRLAWRLLPGLGLLLAAVLFAFAFYLYTRPKTYEGMGEITYAGSDGSYQLVLNHLLDHRYSPEPTLTANIGEEESYRTPCWLYVNESGTGADAADAFMEKVDSVKIEIQQPDGSLSPVRCSEPEPMDFNPEAALGTLVDFTRESPDLSRILWIISMKNGDTIRLGMDLSLYKVKIHNYSPENADLSDSQALQALIDQIAEEIDYRDAVNITLPAVTYTEPLVLHGPSINLTGSESENGRTTFTAGIQMRDGASLISYLTGIDFKGDGTGVALSAAGRLWTKDCTFDGWKTALLVFGNVWANATDCSFTNNGIGIHYNSTDVSPSDSHFTGNIFTGNSTGVLLENVPAAELTLNFGQCLFENNGTDLDNQCQQPVDVSEALFR